MNDKEFLDMLIDMLVAPDVVIHKEWIRRLMSMLKEKDRELAKRESEALNWAKIAGKNQRQLNKLAGEIEEKDKEIRRISCHCPV